MPPTALLQRLLEVLHDLERPQHPECPRPRRYHSVPTANMTKSRLEAFSDGVIAILITIMVLELHTPHSPDLAGWLEVLPTVGLYALSFVYLGIYWNNHHLLLHAANQINGAVLWANLHLLFWLSLVPF